MSEELEMLFACGAEEFERVDGSTVNFAAPPLLSKLSGGSAERIAGLFRSLRGRIITDIPLPVKGRKYLLYRFDGNIPYPAFTVTEATEWDKQELAELFSQMYISTEGVSPPPELALRFAEEKRRDTAVIKENGRVIGMARIAFRGKNFGRINTVVVSREHRGKGVAKALVSALASSLLSEGLIPTVLASADNITANSLYRSLGFTAAGELYEYALTDELSENPLIMNTLA